MKKIRFYLFTAAGFAVLVGALALTGLRTSQAQTVRPPEVKVVNSILEPVPVSTRGTTNISGSVSVTNTPTVNLAPGASFGIDPSANVVRVANSEFAPVAVRDVDYGRQPFHQSADFLFPDGAITRTISMTIPATKRLVIEYVSGHFSMPTGQNVTKIALGVTLDQQFANHFVARVPLGDSGLGNEFFGASQQMRVYADGLFINVQRSSSTAPASGTVTVSGYLVDAP